ncbi:DUF1501 domain-containing protein [Maioricimonas sp. JC845]|uniref:DUF1501 domain-containing protein n=1 Tax=Maioricimonas sp. JC845 TaxID=3232138 RepID=UPI0034593246
MAPPRTTHSVRLSRRRLLQTGSAAMVSLGLLGRLPAVSAAGKRSPRARRCILIWLDGGPSHLDTFDLKPDAPEEVRGPFAPIDTEVPGIRISEHLPETARQMRHVAVIRSMTSPLGEHNFGSHYLLTGYRPTPVLKYPGYGSVLAHLQPTDGLMPANIAVPDHNSEGGAGFLPGTAGPFDVGSDPARPDFRVQDLDLFAGIDPDRLERRRQFLDTFDRFTEGVETVPPDDAGFDQAYRLVASRDAKRAFDISSEPQTTRDRYGRRSIGQACLLARRLVEAGVPFVTVRDRGWDTHTDLHNRLKEGFTGGTVGKVPTLDLAYSALIADLHDRGLLDDTLVILMGEFGRTPKINTSGGRDHWPRVFSVALAGGGITGGQAIGRSDAHGESPENRPVTPEDLARTVYTLLGINPDHELVTPDGRPVAVNRGGELITELL